MADRRFVMLDRDGTLIVERHYLSDPDEVELLPNAASGLRQLRALGLGLVVITNQSAIGRGMFDESRLRLIHQRMCDLLSNEGVVLDGVYYCPHVPADCCRCRKPRTGLIEQAAADLRFRPEACFMIGDKPCDIEVGQRVGATTLLVRTGYGARVEEQNEITPEYIADDLRSAAHIIHRRMAVDNAHRPTAGEGQPPKPHFLPSGVGFQPAVAQGGLGLSDRLTMLEENETR